MRIQLVTVALLATAAHAGSVPAGWKTYRSEQFGWELSYPPSMELKAYLGGVSADLRDATTGAALAVLEVWPPDLCPRDRPGTTAEALGTERLATLTQADGADGSSSCGPPRTVRRSASDRDVPLYEVGLTCTSERIVGRRTVRHREGHKGPTFFADISQPWRRRVLTIDPVGVDPRLTVPPPIPDVAAIRSIVATVGKFSLPDPNVVCIEDLRPGAIGGAIVVPRHRDDGNTPQSTTP
jgi:hypothetical protein